jgi:hypothetical protein
MPREMLRFNGGMNEDHNQENHAGIGIFNPSSTTKTGNYVLDVEQKWAYPFLNRG